MGTLFKRGWRLVACVAILAVALPLASASSGLAATTTSWAAPYFNFGNTNYNTSEATLGVSNVASLSQHSTYLLPAGALDLSNILSVGTHQYVEYSTENQAAQFYEHVTEINMATGKAKWTTSSLAVAGLAVPYTGQPGPIAYQGGVIYASAYDHLDAVNATTGAILWSFVPSQTTARPASAGSRQRNRVHPRRRRQPRHRRRQRHHRGAEVDVRHWRKLSRRRLRERLPLRRLRRSDHLRH